MKNKKSAPKAREYDHLKIEPKWRKIWDKKGVNKTKDDAKGKKFYVLDMFPYPSGDGLHVGHPRGYIATDVYAKYKRMHGFNVLHPMGWDAFGLPAENYAIKNKIHPDVAMKRNVKRFKEQLSTIGLGYDWNREINTTDPAYFKWTQWIFLQLFKKGLAYESFEPINWCPSCKTGLANEDLEDGRCERCGTPVEKKPMRQWVLKITDYADRLLGDLDVINSTASLSYGSAGVPCFTQIVEPGVVKKDKPFVEGNSIMAIVKHWSEDKYVGLKWKKVAWRTLITGRIEKGQTPEEAVLTEMKEETGYVNTKLVRHLGKLDSKFFHVPKNENRFAHFDVFYVELADGQKNKLTDDEKANHDLEWVNADKFEDFLTPESHIYAWTSMYLKKEFTRCRPLLNWPESVKEAQRNWIGRSEGSELWFNVKNSEEKIRVFTTRPDTLFGVTYVVLAPENKLVDELKPLIKNWAEVEKYRESVKAKSEIERTAAGKDKTGLRLVGVEAKHPLTKEVLPVFIADYVLNNYGTGAVMAVPAHDERDYAFAKKYDLPIKEVVIPERIDKRNPPVPGKEKVERKNVQVIVKNPKTGKYLCLHSVKHGWNSFPMGGVEEGEDLIEAAKREVMEETGYTNLINGIVLGGQVRAEYFAKHKDQNRISFTSLVSFELAGEEKVAIAEEEKGVNDILWIDKNKLNYDFMCHAEMDVWVKKIETGPAPYTESGVLINSGNFDGLNSEEAMRKITEAADGQQKVTYKLKDWVFSRQRYWGEPIPLIHCEKCGVVAVPEKDLPVTLPKVKFYEPTGTGESPLAAIAKWVNVKCPNCHGKAKRETNTMPQWAGSSWYYLRYIDPKNKKVLVDKKKEKYWMKNGVDLYVGGTEHATRHLIYARFWHKFLFDIGVVSETEPFQQLKNQGMILGSDSRKMSKRWGNVVNPDDVVKNVGADTLRVYEMFMGPFNQEIAWSTDNMVGSRRFLDKVWRLQNFLHKSSSPLNGVSNRSEDVSGENFETLLHKTIKKVTEDILSFNFNTAISAFMILVNMAEKTELIKSEYEIILKLLAPFAPHLTEEIWSNLGHKKSIHLEKWPEYDERKIVSEKIVIIVQINGKPRASFELPVGSSQAEAEKVALAREDVSKWLVGKQIKKKLFLKERILALITD